LIISGYELRAQGPGRRIKNKGIRKRTKKRILIQFDH